MAFKTYRITKLHEFLKGKVLWNLFIRFFIQQFISLVLSAAINFNYVRYSIPLFPKGAD